MHYDLKLSGDSEYTELIHCPYVELDPSQLTALTDPISWLITYIGCENYRISSDLKLDGTLSGWFVYFKYKEHATHFKMVWC